MKQSLIYIANTRLPTEKAHGLQIIKMASAFATRHREVTLVVPRRRQINPDLRGIDVWQYYQVDNNFEIQSLWNLDLLPLHQLGINTGSVAFILQEASFAFSALCWLLQHQQKDPLIYSRSKLVAVLAAAIGLSVVFEAHQAATLTYLNRQLVAKAKAIVCISKSIEKSWQDISATTIYAPDAVGDEFFLNISQTKAEAHLNVKVSRPAVVYTGNLYAWKGVGTLIKVAEYLPQVNFYLVGGSVIDNNIAPLLRAHRFLKNLHLVGHQPYGQMPYWLGAADLLVIPNSAKSTKSSTHTSPLKLFEYMASGRPILAADVPAIREVVSENEVSYFMSDNASDLSEKITDCLEKPNNDKPRRAQQKARHYSWHNRANVILEALEKL